VFWRWMVGGLGVFWRWMVDASLFTLGKLTLLAFAAGRVTPRCSPPAACFLGLRCVAACPYSATNLLPSLGSSSTVVVSRHTHPLRFPATQPSPPTLLLPSATTRCYFLYSPSYCCSYYSSYSPSCLLLLTLPLLTLSLLTLPRHSSNLS
jgi:hypothetical protein